ncbi:MAG: DNA/RNA non-specific endonuclease [Bacteroidota bacterium]
MKSLNIFITSLIFLSQHSFGQNIRPEIHCEHFFYGYPFGTPATNDLIIRDIYALSNNDETKFADWVAYRLSMHEVDGDLVVDRKWKADPWLDESETLEPKSGRQDDYGDANDQLETDRGHQAPLASFKGSRHASQTNYLSNITPQKSELNSGVWKDLEGRVRDIVRDVGEVYVMTGPVYERTMRTLPEADENHRIPSGYWKIVCTEANGDIEVAAFFFDQDTPRNDKVLAHHETVDFVEQKSGLDFFWLLANDVESVLESTKNFAFARKYFSQED